MGRDMSAVRNKATGIFRARRFWQRERECKDSAVEKDLSSGSKARKLRDLGLILQGNPKKVSKDAISSLSFYLFSISKKF